MFPVVRIRKVHNQLTMSGKEAVFAQVNYCLAYGHNSCEWRELEIGIATQ